MRALAFLLFLLLAAPSGAAPTIVSPAPESVSVTFYRNPDRAPDASIDPEEPTLGGYALITEKRVVDLPKGVVTIRFEGVASGIQPETSILSGAEPAEKNQDRRLLSQGALIDAFTGQQVLLRRTDRATGKVSLVPARVRSGANGVIVETAEGVEALKCTGLSETLLYPGIPADVTAKPVLSMTTREQPGGRRTLLLSYLTANFDWQANYVGDLSADGSHIDLFAWLTLASRDDSSFQSADAYAVAGTVARAPGWQWRDSSDARGYDVIAQCWPSGTGGEGLAPPPPPPPAPIMMMAPSAPAMDIVVTGARRAVQEQLGDLKLYRIPFPVTVAARSQKQVAFLSKPNVQGELIYRSDFGSGDEEPHMLLRLQNRKDQGLGEPLPAGRIALFQRAGGQRLLVGESSTPDKAVGEEVEFTFGAATNVSVDDDEVDDGDHWEGHRLTVSNANPFAIIYEARFSDDPDTRYEKFGRRLIRKNGRWVWRVSVPANGKAVLDYREVEIDS